MSRASILLLVVLTVCLLSYEHVNCQAITKSVYYTLPECKGDAYSTFYISSSPCTYTPPVKCNTITTGNSTIYVTFECATQIPSTPQANNMNSYLWQNVTGKCAGNPYSLQMTPLNKCVIEFASIYYTIVGTDSKTLYTDSKCLNRLYSYTVLLDQCLSGYSMNKVGSISPQASPSIVNPVVIEQQYERVMVYNGSVAGGDSCSNGLSGQIYRPVNNTCISASCQRVGIENFSQKKECTKSLPGTMTGTFQIHTYLDQSTCIMQKSLLQMEIYSIDTCSPYSLVNNNTELLPLVYIKSDGCNVIRKYNDSSCSNVISKVDLTSNLNNCGNNGLKYLCVPNNNGGGGNNGGITGGNSTRANSSHQSTHFEFFLILLTTLILGIISF